MNENARRLLALGASVGLVGAAFAIRGGDDDGGGGGGTGGDGGRRLVCTTDLAEVCDALSDDYDVRVEDAVVTADALTGAARADDVDADLWLVARPWAESVATTRELAGDPAVTGGASGTVARSPVVLVVQESRADALAGDCGGDVRWACVGDVADQPWTEAGGPPTWGTVKAGIAAPGAGSGLLALGAAVADHLGRPDFASNDFDGSLDNWLSGLAATAATSDRPDVVEQMITGGPGIMAALGTVEAGADAALERDVVRVVVPEPIVTADLVVVPIADEGSGDADDAAGDADDLAGEGDLLDALAAAGWRVEGRDPAEGIDAALELPDEAGVPRGDVLRVLLDRWSQL